jgi:TP901 family phage tail tape measure protein
MSGFDLVARLRLTDVNFSQNMRRASQSMNGLRSGINDIVKSMGLAVSAGTAVSLAMSSVSKAMDFDQELKTIQALTGMTNSELKQMSDLALKAGQETSWSASESAKAIEELAKAGMSTATIMKGGLTASLNLATAGGMNLADSASLLSNAMNAFRKDGLDAAKTANILAGAANASSADMTDLKFGLAAVGSVSAGVGMGLKDTSAALALFSNYALAGSDAGTSFKTFLMNLQPQTKSARMEFQKLGLMTKNGTNLFYDAHGKIKSLSDIAGILSTSMKNLTDKQRQQALQTLFGSDAIRAGNILFEAGAAGVNKMYSEMGKVTAMDVARQKMNSATGAVETLKGAFETFQIQVMTPLLPKIKEAANKFADWMASIKPSQVQQWGDNIANAAQKAIDFANFIHNNWSSVKTVVVAMTSAFIAFRASLVALMIIQTITKLVAAYRAGTLLATIAQMSLNTAMLANPIGLVILAIAGLIAIGVLLYKNWDTVKEKMSTVWHIIQRDAASAVNTIIGGINKMIGLINKIPGVSIPLIPKVHWGSDGETSTSYAKLAAQNGGYDSVGTVNGAYLATHSHAGGLSRVPYDGYLARLHKDERVLTAGENASYNKGNNNTYAITVHVNGQLTDQRTIDTLLDAMVTKIQLAGGAGA